MTTWSPSLTGRSGPTYIALANAIAEAVESGDLTPGERLPARRDLAHALKVSVNTVSSAYQEAERRGYVQGEVGRGTFVRRRTEETFTYGHPAGLIDLSICRPAVIPDQMQAIRDVIRAAADEPDLASMLACRPIIGLTDHRISASRWLYRLGMPADPNDIVITNGCSHGLFVALSAIVEPDDVVVTDGLTDHGIIALSSLLKFNLKPLATDEEGITPESFRAIAAKNTVKALVTTPTLNNPTCTIMSAERREHIAAIAAEHDVAIIEDDVFSPLLEDSPPPLASFHSDNSYYVTSLTKCTVPGMRVGYLVGPSRNTQRLVARVRTTSWMATPLAAELASRWIDDGFIDEIVAGQRRELAARQTIAASYLDDFETKSHPVGPNIWLSLPGEWRAEGFVRHAFQRGVVITPPEPFIVGRSAAPHAVRLSVGSVETRAELERALEILRDDLTQRPEPAFMDV